MPNYSPGSHAAPLAETGIEALGEQSTPSRSITWIERVDARVDYALADNQRAERLIVLMALALFLVGLLVVLLAYVLRNPYVASAALVTQTLLIFPFREIRRLRQDNLVLQIFPVLIDGLPQDVAAKETKILLAYIRSRK